MFSPDAAAEEEVEGCTLSEAGGLLGLSWARSAEGEPLLRVEAAGEVGTRLLVRAELRLGSQQQAWELPPHFPQPFEVMELSLAPPEAYVPSPVQQLWISPLRVELVLRGPSEEVLERQWAPLLALVWPGGMLEVLEGDEVALLAPQGIWFDSGEAEQAALQAEEEGMALEVASPLLVVEHSP